MPEPENRMSKPAVADRPATETDISEILKRCSSVQNMAYDAIANGTYRQDVMRLVARIRELESQALAAT
jgi:hypothetical protein